MHRPIFILGIPRSGNTLLAAILNRHPELLIWFEINTFNFLYRKWLRLVRHGANPRATFLKLVSNALMTYNQRFQITDWDIEACIMPVDPDWATLLSSYMALLLNRAKPSARRWGDKTPHHVGHLTHIQYSYPKAQFIYVYRNPHKVVQSLSNPTFDPASDDPIINAGTAKYYLEVYQSVKAQINQEQLLEICYEVLVREPEALVREICQFLDVTYLDSLLEEADAQTRWIVGWPEYKAWGKIEAQSSSRSAPQENHFISIYLADWLAQYGEVAPPKDFLFYRSYVRLLPFLIIRQMLRFFWAIRYPGFPFFLLKYPGYRSYWRWIKPPKV